MPSSPHDRSLDSHDAWHEASSCATTLPLVTETLSVGRERVTTATVRVGKHVLVQEREVDEPLYRDEVRIERTPIGRVVDEVPPVREEGDTIVVPVVEEVLVVERRLVLKEEVRILRRRVERRERRTVVLRREEAIVERLEAGTDGSLDKSMDEAADADPQSPTQGD